MKHESGGQEIFRRFVERKLDEESRGNDWRPMNADAKDGNNVLLWGPTIGHIVASYDGDLDNYPWSTLDGPNYHKGAFTHWMPLPEPPGERMPRHNGGDDEYRTY